VLDDFGGQGLAWRETDLEDTDLETIIRHLLEGQYRSPVRVIGFNIAEGWVRDVSEDVARELRQGGAPIGSASCRSLWSASSSGVTGPRRKDFPCAS
jgi:hypothetical protein